MENNIKNKERITLVLNLLFIISICISIFTMGYIVYLNIIHPHFDKISIIIQKNESLTAGHLLFGFRCYDKTTFERLNFIESDNGDMKASCAPRTNQLGELHYFLSSNDLDICIGILLLALTTICVSGIARDVIKDKIEKIKKFNPKKVD